MARKKKIEVGAINIRVHPHPSEDHYISLLKDAFSLRQSVSSRGDQKLLISTLNKPEIVDGVTQVSGVITRFTDIDSDQPWFNVNTNDEAQEEDVEQISIPDHLKPNYKPFYFVFYPKKHRLVFEKYSGQSSISHGVVASLFINLFKQPKILNKYGLVNVTVVSDRKGLEAILEIDSLKQLYILVERPNPDDHEDEERALLNRLNAQNVNKLEQNLTAINGQSIEPDNQTITLANVAIENGTITGRGKDRSGKTVSYSTEDFPRTEQDKYDPDITSGLDILLSLSKKFLR